MAARQGLLALQSSAGKDSDQATKAVLAYARAHHMSSKSLRRVLKDLGTPEDDIDDDLSVEGLCSLLATQSGHDAEADAEELRTTENCEGEGGNSTVDQSHVDARAHAQRSLPDTVLCMFTKLVKISDMQDVILDLKSSFKAEMAVARDREQRLVNRISHLEKMLKEQSETEEKASDLLKSLDGSTTSISHDVKKLTPESTCSTMKAGINQPKLHNCKVYRREEGELGNWAARITVNEASAEYLCNRNFWCGRVYARPWIF